MKETLKIAAVLAVTSCLVTVAVIRHKNAVPVAPVTNQAQIQLSAAKTHISNLEAQVASVNDAAANTKANLCAVITQHKITPTPADCQ